MGEPVADTVLLGRSWGSRGEGNGSGDEESPRWDVVSDEGEGEGESAIP